MPNNAARILVLGATGHFGKRLTKRLIRHHHGVLILAGRSADSCQAFATELESVHSGPHLECAQIEQRSDDLPTQLAKWSPQVVIHTAGPYQELDYRVAKCCIEIGAHYIDLADGRDFVTGISRLNQEAMDAGVLVVSGASTLPGLSGAVLDEYRSRFAKVETVDICIAPAHQTPRGLSTVQAVLSYCGKPFEILKSSEKIRTFGWQGLRIFRHPALGWRLAADCDVPDLELLAADGTGIRSVRFQASLEAKWEQLALYVMATITRLGLVKDWTKYTPTFTCISNKLLRFGSDVGGMSVRLIGFDQNGADLRIDWFLTARENHGPEIPSVPAAIIARKLLSGEILCRGAMPCVGLFSLADFAKEVSDLEISWTEFVEYG